ncbi:acetyl-CoA carboxylase biotin carboxylase subunit family protein [Streptomyces sp. NBC_01408]|uniref:ATP-grasp domain-containing protein n=1 Tax=Streptomyces sp. NBC_01408 TaxID=2903855 RepID=UPI002256A772|nr:ATP-grasp domain-containing protein [Streptomyces sp. NBC_01408]MCX4694983.1 ATP-grasp domain-containing protein [Streptomyces sp. NBC_01408]
MAFLRSVGIQRADPYIQQAVRGLAADGIEAGLFHTSGSPGDEDFPGYRERLDRGVTPRELADAVAAWGADAAVSISLPCENALRDAVAKAFLDAVGIPTVMTPLAATMLLVDKWETKKLCAQAGLKVPDGFRADSGLLAGRGLPAPGYRDALRVQAERIGYPLMSKPAWDSTSMGIRTLHSAADLDAYLASPPEVSAVVEQVVEGDLCSVDIVGRPGSYRVLPLCWTGRAGAEPVFTFADLRWCGPRRTADAAFAEVARTLITLCGNLGVCGSVNVDMVYTGGQFVILEVNPRIGGATTLSCAASGTNTFTSLARMARGLPPAGDTVQRAGWAIEFLAGGRMPPAVVAELRNRVAVVTAHELVIDGTSHGDIVVVTLAEGEEDRTVKALTELHGATGFPAADVMGKISSLLSP